MNELAAYIVENWPKIEQAVAAYEAWGLNRLEAVANGYIDCVEEGR